MSYIQGFVIPVLAAKKEAYRAMAAKTAPIFLEYGAERIVECWGDALPDGTVTDFRRAVKAEDGENVVFSWIVWPSKAVHDAANEKMMSDERTRPDQPMPFDGKRMIYGGFEPIFDNSGRLVMSANGFVWYELVTSDTAAAKAFYGKVVGWDAQAFDGGPGPYEILSMKGRGVGGLMRLSEGMREPFWMGYVGTPDIDAAVARWKGAGGSVHRAFEIPNIGRIALVSDPQGAGLAMIQGASERVSEAFDQSAPGHGNWHELHTTDAKTAFDFYARQFGWTKGPALDMGAMGAYQLFETGGVQIGGMMNSPNLPRPMWLYYFGTGDIDDAAKRVSDNGGAILLGPSEVPGGGFIIQARDPQGAMFALVGRRA